MSDKMTKMEKCRYCRPIFQSGTLHFRCTFFGNKTTFPDPSECENCPHFKSRYIEYPITVKKINKNTEYGDLYTKNVGHLCEIRLANDDTKTYIGILLGELPIDILVSYDDNTKELNISYMPNPAIFIPELKKIVYGCESWWRLLDEHEQPQGITDKDINNQWYVQLAKTLSQDNKPD